MRRILQVFVGLLSVTLSLLISFQLQNSLKLIPKWLIHFPPAKLSKGDFFTVAMYALLIHVAVLMVYFFSCRNPDRATAKFTVDQAFAYLLAFSVTVVSVFVTTAVPFDPNFFVNFLSFNLLFLLSLYALARLRGQTSESIIKPLFTALRKRSFSWIGITVLLVSTAPGVVAKLFVSNRDFANLVTQVRIRFASSSDHSWKTVNAFPGKYLHQPILTRFQSNDPSHLYVLERGGRLFRIPWNREGTEELLLDFSKEVGFVEIENGALGFDFHPDFGKERKEFMNSVFVYYTSVHDNVQQNRLSVFSLDGTTPQERAKSEKVLMRWDRKNDGFHNGGSVLFGPDGYLYIAVGEMSDRESHQRIDRSLVGGILRIDVDRKGNGHSHPVSRQPVNGFTQGYFIPDDNPFVGEASALEEFWAIGLRNPFRINFDTKTNMLWAGEVGSTEWEEINVIRKGNNYQFPYIEGSRPTSIAKPVNIYGTETGPVYTYFHTAYDRAVIGGIVYRHGKYKSLNGKYIFGDSYSGKIFIGDVGEGDTSSLSNIIEVSQANQFAQRGITSFTETPDGEILITALGSLSSSGGEILKLVPVSTLNAAGATTPIAPPSASSVVDIKEVETIFASNCSRCHGSRGHGDGPDAEALKIAFPDFTNKDFHTKRTDEHIEKVIKKGGSETGLSPMMPPWERVLSPEEITSLVRYIRSLEGKK